MTERPYYAAPDFLEHVYTLCDPQADYDFSDVVIVRDVRDGRLWAAHDSGCSCPAPFEDHVFPTDFTELRLVRDLVDFVAGVPYTKYDARDVIRAEKAIANARRRKVATSTAGQDG